MSAAGDKKISPGFRFGKLTVKSDTGRRKNGYIVWNCACDCGGSIELDMRTIRRGTVLDCGCETKVKPGQRDVTGERFGRLTALYPAGGRGYSGDLIWHCKCDCGGEIDAPLSQLRAGYRKSCGCLSHPPLKDYVGKRFGNLTVLCYEGKRSGMHRWRCLCDCGRETVVGQTPLQNGKKTDCGCRCSRPKHIQTGGSKEMQYAEGITGRVAENRVPFIEREKDGPAEATGGVPGKLKSYGSRQKSEENENRKIGIGFRFGKLTIAAKTRKKKNGYTIWQCDCDCGGSIELDTRAIQRGAHKDCGCGTKVPMRAKDLTGQRFGKLTALYPTEMRRNGGSVVWHCKCDCGGEVDTSLHQLRAGYRKSCGCLSNPPLKELVGKRFGKLTVISYEGKWKNYRLWRCRCDCGNETVVRQNFLQCGHTTSCGCAQAEAYRENLKLVEGTSVTVLESLRKKRRSNNTSGYTGVYQRKPSGRWTAEIRFQGKWYYLGDYDKKEDAIKARKRGEEMHDDFLEWYYSTYEQKRKQENTL